jgi:alkanesulfonate monooxygenase SsuD/methylene tetrahydromethanopterin reductase-like flavin-dependent oxidoreductase (luciferase family)
MMTTCVVGRDNMEVRDRLQAWAASSTLDHTPRLAGTVEQVAETLREYESIGVERAMLQHLAHQDLDMVAVLGDLARELAA